MVGNRKKDYGFALVINNEEFFFIIIDYSYSYEILQVYLAATSKSLYIFKYDSQQSFLVEKCLDFPNYSSSLKIFIAYNFYCLYIHGQSTKSIDAYTLQ